MNDMVRMWDVDRRETGRRAYEFAGKLNRDAAGGDSGELGDLAATNSRKLVRSGYGIHLDGSGRFYVRDWRVGGCPTVIDPGRVTPTPRLADWLPRKPMDSLPRSEDM